MDASITDYRKGKKKRIRISVRRKKCHFARKAKNWYPSNHQSSIIFSNTPTRQTLTNSKFQDSEDQQYNISNDTTPTTSISNFRLTIEPETAEATESNDLLGRRIVDSKYLFEAIKKINHPGLDCNFSHMEFKKEIRLGHLSKYLFKCSLCNKEETIYSEDPAKKVNINIALVEGMICTGNGFSQLDEICGAINMPCMAKSTFQKIESNMQSIFEECALEEMRAAGEEEKRLAILNNEVDSEGYPLVPVVADGSWPKRSFKSGFSSLSGCACIVGHRTKKILFMGIRNKFCCICSRAENKGIPIPEHTCYKNWSHSATSMEEDIIAEGFQRSIEMHGIKYNMLIGDGDSGIINKLLITMPYGPNLIVKKVECKNHLLRNFCTKMKLLGKKTNNHKGYVPVTLRKKVEDSILRLRKAVVCAVKYRKDEDLPQAEKVQNLKQDIRNSANHVFGKHELCAPYFCQRPTEFNLVPELEKTGMWVDIQKHLSYLVNNAGSLLLDVTNNCAEQFNSVIAKFIGGKRVNFTSRGSYQTRCLAAVTSWNSEVQTHYRLQKKIANASPGYYTKSYTEKRKRALEYVRKRKLDFSEAHKTLKKRPKRCESDQHYGLLELEQDLPDDEYETKKDNFLASLMKTEEEIRKLEIDTRGQGDNDLWLTERRKRLTASKFGTICKLRQSTSCLSTIKSLIYSTFKGNSATEYGKQHESEAIRQFSQLTKLEVKPCGLYVDKNDYYLGASPDGIIEEDAIVEIKCPSFSSTISPLQGILKKKIHFCQLREDKLFLKRNHDYYYQVQGQLHVTGRKLCYFVVWTPHGLEYEKIEKDDEFWNQKMLPKLETFYFECLLPELIDPRVPRKMPIRERAGYVNTKKKQSILS